ncbi:MAG: hypothetical protein OEM24_08135 [Paracoccaceae bacterium]|nr:hypothetical protein [Paracoccaceae bacterium]
MSNPIFAPWERLFNLPCFAEIGEGRFEPAFEAALADARADIARIVDNSEAPTCAGAVEAPIRSRRPIEKRLTIWLNIRMERRTGG